MSQGTSLSTGASFAIQLPANRPGKAEDEPSLWILLHMWETQKLFLASALATAAIQTGKQQTEDPCLSLFLH